MIDIAWSYILYFYSDFKIAPMFNVENLTKVYKISIYSTVFSTEKIHSIILPQYCKLPFWLRFSRIAISWTTADILESRNIKCFM